MLVLSCGLGRCSTPAQRPWRPCRPGRLAAGLLCASPRAWQRSEKRRWRPGVLAASAEASVEASVQELEAEFGIPGFVEVRSGREGRPTVVLTHACGASAEITLSGAKITSWQFGGGEEVLFLPPDPARGGSTPAVGGIALFFPQAGPGTPAQQGFASAAQWQLAATSIDAGCGDNRHPEVALVLRDTEDTRALWPHPFHLALSVMLRGEQLHISLAVVNPSDEPLEFEAALRCHLRVADIQRAAVRGLEGLEWLDRHPDAQSPVRGREEQEAVGFSGRTDLLYLGAAEPVQLETGRKGPCASVTLAASEGWSDVGVWNPWTALPDCYREFVCVEGARARSAAVLQPGQEWRARLELAVGL